MRGSIISKKLAQLRPWTWTILSLFSAFILTQVPCSAANVENKSAASKKELASKAEKKWGILPLSVKLTASGQLVDYRYLVIDPAKAEAIMKLADNAYLIDQTSGTKLSVARTKTGPQIQPRTRPIAGQIYPILFYNTAKVIKPGNQVTLVVGELRMEDIVVEAAIPPQRGLTQTQRAKGDFVQKALRKERGSCIERCRQERGCQEKCDTAYKSWLNKEYQKILDDK